MTDQHFLRRPLALTAVWLGLWCAGRGKRAYQAKMLCGPFNLLQRPFQDYHSHGALPVMLASYARDRDAVTVRPARRRRHGIQAAFGNRVPSAGQATASGSRFSTRRSIGLFAAFQTVQGSL